MPFVERAERLPLRMSIMYRRTGDEDWFPSRVFNISDTGILFGPTELEPGVSIEVLLSPPVQVGSLAPGIQLCLADVMRATDAGAVAVRLAECRFILAPES